MENKLKLVVDMSINEDEGISRRHSSSSACTPPRSPLFLIHKPPSSPGGLSNCSASSNEHIRNPRNSLSPFGRYSSNSAKKVCTMDCAHCRHMARNLRSESPNFNECLSAPCSRKSSVVYGKF